MVNYLDKSGPLTTSHSQGQGIQYHVRMLILPVSFFNPLFCNITPRMELDNIFNAQWLYLLYSAAQKTMETPLTLLQLSIKILQFVKSIDNDADVVNQMALFNVLKENGEAKKCDLDFLYKIQQRGIQL